MRQIFAQRFIDKDLANEIIVYKYFLETLDEKEKKEMWDRYEQIVNLPLPYDVYLRSNGEKSLDTIAQEIHDLKDSFLKKFPYYRLFPIIKTFERIIKNKNVVWKNESRKMREKPNVVNVLRNSDYLIFIYNRKLVDSQGDLAFIGIPLSLLILSEFEFLDDYVPDKIDNFEIIKHIFPSMAMYSINWDV